MMIQKQMWTDNPSEWTEDELLLMKYKGICYGKGSPPSPPPAPAVQTAIQQSEFPTELKPFIEDIFGKAQAIQEQRTEEGFPAFPGALQAEFDPTQVRAFEAIEEIPGRTEPFFDRATEFAETAALAPIDPAEQALFMNPFIRNVLDVEKREAERIGDIQKQQADARAAQAGAFGGSRAAIIEAERQRSLNQQLGDIESRGLAAAFQDAQNRIAQQRQREAGAATQLASLGSAIPAQQLKELGALSGLGAARQTQEQRGIDLARQEFEAEEAFPLQTLQEFSSILRGFPLEATRRTEAQQFSAAQPLSTQLLGVGTQALGALGAGALKGAFGQEGGMVENLPRKRTALESLVSQTEGLDTQPVVAMARGGSFLDQLFSRGLLGTNKAQKLLGKVRNPGLQALTGFMGPKFIKQAQGLFGVGANAPAATPIPPAAAPQIPKAIIEKEKRRRAAAAQQTAARGTGLGQVGSQLAGVRQNVGVKGGGGLRQMVKLPLPSNRVQFGKEAYKDTSYFGPRVERPNLSELFQTPLDVLQLLPVASQIISNPALNIEDAAEVVKMADKPAALAGQGDRPMTMKQIAAIERGGARSPNDKLLLGAGTGAGAGTDAGTPGVKPAKETKLLMDPKKAGYLGMAGSDAGQRAAKRYFGGENEYLASLSEGIKEWQKFKLTEEAQKIAQAKHEASTAVAAEKSLTSALERAKLMSDTAKNLELPNIQRAEALGESIKAIGILLTPQSKEWMRSQEGGEEKVAELERQLVEYITLQTKFLKESGKAVSLQDFGLTTTLVEGLSPDVKRSLAAMVKERKK